MQKIEIKNRWSGEVLFSAEAETLKAACEAAIKAGAYLYGANLSRANLSRADLSGAVNAGAALAPCREDIRKVLDAAPEEVAGLLEALWQGKVDGSTYAGECACLVGTLEKVRGKGPNVTIPGLPRDASRPAERWFANVRNGDTPVTNPSSAFAAAVVAEWMMDHGVLASVLPKST